MRFLRVIRIRRAWVMAVLLGGLLFALPAAGRAQCEGEANTGGVSSALERRMQAFVAAVNSRGEAEIAAFFPRTGDFTYRHTAHAGEGERVGIWRFPAADALRTISTGPLWRSFTIQYERQPIGLFAHQAMTRRGTWRRVRGNRFVPPGASARSGAFVEWRREGGEWVVSEFGDESFPGGRLPSWFWECA